jgi:SAM-dependent methyltransferase
LLVGGWLLTPVVAWAVAFWGSWIGATLGVRFPPVAGLVAMGVGALGGAVGGLAAWMWVLRRLRGAAAERGGANRGDVVKLRSPQQETWDRYWGDKALVSDVYPAVTDLLGEITRVLPDLRGRRLLEVGAGTGREAHALADRGATAVALDFSPQALRLSRQISPGVRLVRGDALRAPFRSESFDLVYHQGLLEHFRDPAPLLDENRRLLRRGGLLLVDVPQAFHAYTILKQTLMALGRWFAGWETQYSPRGLRRLIERSGFHAVRCYGYGMHPGLTYRVLREALRRVGVSLPLAPNLGPLQAVYQGWHGLLRRIERSGIGPWVSLTVGIIARRED